MKILDNEIIDDLQLKGLKLIQKKNGFKFGIDAVLLSDFVQIDKNAKVFDIGTGTGILPVLLYGKDKGDTFFGIDIQEDMIEMAQRSAVLNGIEDYVRFVLCDVKDTNSRFEGGSFDAVVTNPPYMKAGDGLLNPNPAKAVSRHEVACTIDDILKASHYLLKEKGKLFMVHRPHRLRIFRGHEKVQNRTEKDAFRISANAKEPNLVLLCASIRKQELRGKPLFVYDENNQYTEEVRKIYLRT